MKKSARPKLLFICPCTPDVLGTGWEQRAYSFLKAYSQFIDIELWFQPSHDNPNLVRASLLSDVCNSAIAFHPLLLSRNTNKLRDRLLRAVSSADCVHINRCLDVVRMTNHHCILWDIDELPSKFRNKHKRAHLTLSDSERTILKKIEDAWRKSTVVFSSSSLESLATFNEPIVVPNSHSRSTSIQRQPVPNSLLFVGNLNYSPNIDGILHFMSAIFPLLIRQTTLTIVGRKPIKPNLRARIDQLKDNERVELHYDVASCAPYFAQSMASIVPIRFGGGTRVKILESFASMCPVISTQKGCEGLAVSDGRELLIADAPAAFASACTKLLDNPVLNKQISKSAHEFFLNEHSQEVVNGIVKPVLEEVLMTDFH